MKMDMENISVMINMYVELEKNLRWYILEIFKNGQNDHKMVKVK